MEIIYFLNLQSSIFDKYTHHKYDNIVTSLSIQSYVTATSTRRFAITLNSTERLGKIEIRNKVLSLLQGLYHNFKEPRQFKVVTLSSMYWIFEKELITTLNNKYYYEDKRGITPLIYSHINPYGVFELDMNKRILL